ncbi:MAG: hypothetical protein GXP62_18940 [Oligoflexia bacterium]|nr:hypothetical protein [Oligoflexia bacterium]
MRVVLTPGGKRRLQARIGLVRAELDAIVADNPAALESGDTSGWHDNFAFEDNQRRTYQLACRLRALERMLDRTELVPPLGEVPERVVVGTLVRWRFEDEAEAEDAVHELWLAGFEDGDPAAGRISYDSPLGRALVGAEEGELREVVIAGVKRKVEILALGPTPKSEWLDESHQRMAL